MSWLQTRSNKKFDIMRPTVDAIDDETLAVALARTARFCGHYQGEVDDIYSVAQHSILVCDILRNGGCSREMQLVGLLHDAHEAYSGFGDVAWPAKQVSPQIAEELDTIELVIDSVIAEKYAIPLGLFRCMDMKRADKIALATEQRDLMGPPPGTWVTLPEPLPGKLEIWRPSFAAKVFLLNLGELRTH